MPSVVENIETSKREERKNKDKKKDFWNNIFRIVIVLFWIGGILFLRKLQINEVLKFLFIINFTYSLVILFIAQHRIAENLRWFCYGFAFIIIFSAGIANQVSADSDIWKWVIIGVTILGSLQNMNFPFMK